MGLYQKANKKAVFSWVLFDWANSSFPTVVITFVIPSYFTEVIAENNLVGTQQWGQMVALSSLVIAILSPIFGSIADLRGGRKPWLAFFSTITIISSALIWFFPPVLSSSFWILFSVSLGVIGFEVGSVFYNAMLSNIAPEPYIGRLSGWAWGAGYFGGIVCLAIALFVFIEGKGAWLGLDGEQYEHIRACGPLVAFWFALFSIPLFLFVPDQKRTRLSTIQAVQNGLGALKKILLQIRERPDLLKFLIAHMIYMDGLNTIFFFGGIYAAGTFGFTLDEIVMLGIAMNVLAGIGGISFAWLDDFFGSKPTILIALMLMILATIILVAIETKLHFIIAAFFLSIFVGPVQASSRALMLRFSPPSHTTELFGLYSFSGKVTSFAGPWIMGIITVAYGNQRYGISSVIVFLVLGALCLLFVSVPKHRPKNW